jgi:hypothetical protein
MRTTALVEPPQRRSTARPAAARPPQASAAVTGAAHDAVTAAALRSRDPRALASAHPDTIRRLQRSVGNAGLASALVGERRGTPARAGGALLQREDGDGVTETAKKVVTTGAEQTGFASNVTGTVASALGRSGMADQATYVGAGAGLLGSGIELMGTAAESYAALGVLMDPGRPQAEHEQALDTLGESVQKVWKSKNSIVTNATAIASTAKASASLGMVSSAAGVVTAYGDFATSLVDWGTDWMQLQEIQELQFTGWSDPARAANEALGDLRRTELLLVGAHSIAAATEKLRHQNAAALEAVTDTLDRTSGALESTRRAEPISADMKLVQEGTVLNEEQRVARLRAERLALVEDTQNSAFAVAAADRRVKQAEQMVVLASRKRQAAFVFQRELRAAADLAKSEPDPQARHVPLMEIRQFAVAQSYTKLKRDTLKVVAAVIGLSAGIFILAFGWTPVGWGLAAAAGVIGLGILAYKGGGWLLRQITGTLTPREVYARRLWAYARAGYDEGFGSKPPPEVCERNAGDALALLRVLGVSWTKADVAQIKPGDVDGAITKIENALKW